MSRAILGVNSAYHESSAGLLVDGELVAFVEEERFNRVRHGKKSRLDNPDELPEAAMAWCLARAGLGFRDLAAAGSSFERHRDVEAHDGIRLLARHAAATEVT